MGFGPGFLTFLDPVQQKQPTTFRRCVIIRSSNHPPANRITGKVILYSENHTCPWRRLNGGSFRGCLSAVKCDSVAEKKYRLKLHASGLLYRCFDAGRQEIEGLTGKRTRQLRNRCLQNPQPTGLIWTGQSGVMVARPASYQCLVPPPAVSADHRVGIRKQRLARSNLYS